MPDATLTHKNIPEGWRLMVRREVIRGGQYVQWAVPGGLLGGGARWVDPKTLYRAVLMAERGESLGGLVPVKRERRVLVTVQYADFCGQGPVWFECSQDGERRHVVSVYLAHAEKRRRAATESRRHNTQGGG